MNIRQQRAIDELNNAIDELVNIPRNSLTYSEINNWRTKWFPLFLKAGNLSGRNIPYFVGLIVNGYEMEKDIAVLDSLRADVLEELRTNITQIDSNVTVKTILEDRIFNVTDRKLRELLEEFNRIKDIAPNHAAIGFRTTLAILLQERAKLVKPNIKLATRNDLDLKACIVDALNEHIFSKDEERLLNSFLAGGYKDVFDFVVHRPGNTQLVDKVALNDAVNLLNHLLPTIIP